MDAATLTNGWSRAALYRSRPDTKDKVLRRRGSEIRVTCTRIIDEPNPVMKDIASAFKDQLRSKGVEVPSASAKKGSDVRRHLGRHRGNRHLVEIDIGNAYRCVGEAHLTKVLEEVAPELGTPKDIRRFVNRYLCARGALATGSPASQDLFNLVLETYIMRWLRPICEKEGVILSHYADNILLSSPAPIGPAFRRDVRQVITSAGFRINWDKCRVIDLAKQPAVINGLAIDIDGRIYVPRAKLRKLSGMMHGEDRGNDKEVGRISGHAGVFRSNTGRTGALNRTEMRVWRETRQRNAV